MSFGVIRACANARFAAIDRRVEGREVPTVLQRHRIARDLARGEADRGVGELARPFEGAEDQGRGPVAERRAVEHAERLGHRGCVDHLARR